MPELPDITVYLDALESRVVGQTLERIQIVNLFVLRTAVPPIESVVGKKVVALRRLGKQIVFGFDGNSWLVLHLMIAGRLHWVVSGKKPTMSNRSAIFEFPTGSLVLTEAGSKKRASLHLFASEDALRDRDRGGLDVLDCTRDGFAERLTRENHTVKRALTDPELFSGMGNAYSDEILHAARLSPVKLTQKMTRGEIDRLFEATQQTLRRWIELLRAETGAGFPEKVTAFRPEMAVHGKFGKPCPVCGAKVQRIRYVDNEANYCPTCQTEGRLLADRSLSRLLKSDWTKTADALDALFTPSSEKRTGATRSGQ